MITLVIMGKIAAGPRPPGEIMTLIFEMPLHARWSWGWGGFFATRLNGRGECARVRPKILSTRFGLAVSPASADIPFENYSLLYRNLRLL
jgi:hypothetical protein